MGLFLYTVCFIMIFLCGFAMPFAVRSKTTAVIMAAAGVALFFGGLWLSEAARGGPPLNFLAVLALSVLPFGAGSLARLITIFAFGDNANKLAPIIGVGALTTALYGAAGFITFGLI